MFKSPLPYFATLALLLAQMTVGVTPGGGSTGVSAVLEQHTASASSSLDFTSWYSASYDQYVIEIVMLRPATDNTNLLFRVSTDGGSSYASGASAYGWSYNQATAAFTSGVGDGTDDSVHLVNSVDTTFTANSVSGTFTLHNPASTTLDIPISGQLSTWQNDSNFYNIIGSGAFRTTGSAVNAFRLIMSSGNIASGTARVYGVTK